jgi:hypothetical protein
MDSVTAPEEGPATRCFESIHEAAEACGMSQL